MIGLIAALLAVVTTPYAPVSYACDGTTANFTVTFPYIASTDLAVTSTTAGGAVTTLVLTTDFVTLNSTTSTATLTVLVPATKCPAGSTLKISRAMSCTQPTSFRQQTSFNPGLVETTSDRVLMCAQQVQAQVASTQNLSFSSQNTFTATQTFSPATSDAIVAQGGGTGRGVVASSGASSGVAAQFTTGNLLDAPIQIVGQTADPTTPANGEVWVNSTQQAAKIRINGASNVFSGNPMLFAATAAGQSFPNGASNVVVYGTVTRDTDSAFNAGTGRYTIPVGKGGDYLVTGCIEWSAAITVGGTALILTKNAAQVATFAQRIESVNGQDLLCGSAVLNAAAGDLLDLRGLQNSGGTVTLFTSVLGNYVSIKRLSD